MGDHGPLHVEMDRLAGLGPVLQGLADEAADLRTGPSADPPVAGGVEPAVAEASSIAHDLVDSVLVSAVKERLSETGEIMVNVANQYRTADASKTSLDTVMNTYSKATGNWTVPDAPTSPPSESGIPRHPTPPVRTHTVVSGDTLEAISQRFYGDARRYQQIADASDVADPDVIHPGQVLKIPPKRQPETGTPDGTEETSPGG
jgi:nucleoid-associated protein YgaU